MKQIKYSLIALTVSMMTSAAFAQNQPPLKVGMMLPYSGTFAALGNAIDNGFQLYVKEQGGKIGGREITYIKVDDESEPSKATDNINKLIKRDNVDVVIGTVHSGVAMAMAKVAKESGTTLIIPNAGADAITGPMCAKNIFRSSFTNGQPGFAMGEVASKKGYKNAMTVTWKYAAAGLNKTIPLVGPGFLTDGTLEAQGESAQGMLTALHYGDNLNIKRDNDFRLAYAKQYKLQPDVYAVQGYDAAQMLAVGLNATKGDITKKDDFAKAIRAAKIDSPRGVFTISKAHNPVQDFYLRQVVGKENKIIGVASKALSDPGRGCNMQ